MDVERCAADECGFDDERPYFLAYPGALDEIDAGEWERWADASSFRPFLPYRADPASPPPVMMIPHRMPLWSKQEEPV